MDSRKSVATRKSIWRLPVRDVNRSKIICGARIDGAAAAQIAAHHTRDRKELLSPEEVLQRHRELAAQYGHQADRVVAQARQHGQYQMPEPEMQAQRAVTWARDHVFERSAVQGAVRFLKRH